MSDNKVMGLEPAKYVKITYILLLVSAGIGLLTSVLALLGIYTLINPLASLLGLIGLIMAVIGWLAFKEKFGSLELDHLKYVVILFLVFLVAGILVGMVMAFMPVGLYIFSILFGAAQVLLLFTGFNSWTHGRTVTKDNVKSEVQAALNRA